MKFSKYGFKDGILAMQDHFLFTIDGKPRYMTLKFIHGHEDFSKVNVSFHLPHSYDTDYYIKTFDYADLEEKVDKVLQQVKVWGEETKAIYEKEEAERKVQDDNVIEERIARVKALITSRIPLAKAEKVDVFILAELRKLKLPFPEGMNVLAERYSLETSHMWGLFKGNHSVDLTPTPYQGSLRLT